MFSKSGMVLIEQDLSIWGKPLFGKLPDSRSRNAQVGHLSRFGRSDGGASRVRNKWLGSYLRRVFSFATAMRCPGNVRLAGRVAMNRVFVGFSLGAEWRFLHL